MQYSMKKFAAAASIILAGGLLAGASNNVISNSSETNNVAVVATVNSEKEKAATLYSELELSAKGLNSDVFEKAYEGMHKLVAKGRIKKQDIITIVDFSQPSTQKRLYVIDLENKSVLFNTLVAHGRNSGSVMANSFSNVHESLKSSPGFYSTAETYMGKHGFSMRLDGLEQNINSNARSRAVVMHGADYVSESAINSLGFIGRSWGCPAVPMKDHKQIINTIKNGTCLFIYSPDEKYLSNSTVLNS